MKSFNLSFLEVDADPKLLVRIYYARLIPLQWQFPLECLKSGVNGDETF